VAIEVLIAVKSGMLFLGGIEIKIRVVKHHHN
jgi:hypothetical protein